jgi:hypothetical protein
MLAKKQLAKTSNDGKATTKSSKPYDIEIGGQLLRIYDTAGFDDEVSQVPSITAVVQLYKLLKELDGVSLLVYCMRAPRAKASAKPNWKLFHEVICRGKVPIVAVITGLEVEKKMKDWWTRNEKVFSRYGLFPQDVACITAIEGKGGVYRQEFRDSRSETERVIKENHLITPWHMEKLEWFKEVFDPTSQSGFCWSVRSVNEKRLVHGIEPITTLIGACGMSRTDAEDVVDAFSEVEEMSGGR